MQRPSTCTSTSQNCCLLCRKMCCGETQSNVLGSFWTLIQWSTLFQKLPSGICNWFKTYLDNFDMSDGGLENVEIFLDSTAPLLASNSGHLPHDLRNLVNRHVAVLLRKDRTTAKGSKKRFHAPDPITSPGNAELVHSDDDRFLSPTNKGKKVCRVQSQRSLYQWKQEIPCSLKTQPTWH